MSAMRARPASVVRFLAAAALLTMCVCGCRVFPIPQEASRHVTAPADKPSVLVVILNALSARSRGIFRSLLPATARPGERLIVISSAGGTSFGSFAAPPNPQMTGPASPTPLRPNATSFQRARYRKTRADVQATLRHDQALLRKREQHDLRAWADDAAAASLAAANRHAEQHDDLAAALSAAAADIAGLQQTGLEFGGRKVIAIVDSIRAGAPTPLLHASLTGIAIAVDDVPAGGSGAAWQADLLQAGASRAIALTQATSSRLPAVVESGLNGHTVIAFQLTRISYGPAQYKLPSSADSSLDEVLQLLTIKYPEATATINGYTDTVPVPGGNAALSWRRARAVLMWLVHHGIAADRLQAVGHGAAQPVAPNRPGGQPLDRRVVIIISSAN
jgi:outer membrane protein OmpA-like peptidoglycan-associated protein